MTLETLYISIDAAVVAVVFAVAIAGELTPLDFWFDWVQGLRESGGWRSWIGSPLGACEKCLAGQLALWYSALIRGGHDPESIRGHVTAACGAVLFALIIGHGYRWIRRKI